MCDSDTRNKYIIVVIRLNDLPEELNVQERNFIMP